jgi:hypothetical protein
MLVLWDGILPYILKSKFHISDEFFGMLSWIFSDGELQDNFSLFITARSGILLVFSAAGEQKRVDGIFRIIRKYLLNFSFVGLKVHLSVVIHLPRRITLDLYAGIHFPFDALQHFSEVGIANGIFIAAWGGGGLPALPIVISYYNSIG